MREWLEKKLVKAVLVVALILVWGYNSYSIVGITNENKVNDNPQKEISIDPNQLKVPDDEKFIYKDNFRNPFHPRLGKRIQEKKSNKKEIQKERVRIPYLKFTGVVEGTALIQNQREKLFFVSRGDSVEGAKVRYVTEDSVGLVLKSREFKLEIKN